MNRPVLTLIAAFIAGTAACATGSGAGARPQEYVAPSEHTVFLETRENPVEETQTIYAENMSSVAVIITSVTLRECVNTNPSCATMMLNTRLEPGQRRQLLTIRALLPGRGFGYRYSYAWRAAAEP